MYHHLRQHDDFEVLEINNLLLKKAEISFLRRVIDAFYARVSRTRWHCWARGYEQLWRYQQLPKGLLKRVRQFGPDVVLTVAHGNLFWLAHNVAHQLQLPLVSIYHDWWPRLLQQSYALKLADVKAVERRFYQLYRQSDCVLCISEGMRQALGDRANAHVLYPAASCQLAPVSQTTTSERFRVLYSGNVVASYGKKLRSLIDSLPTDQSLELVIHGNPHDWELQAKTDASQKGILKPYVPAEQFSQTLSQASALLSVISFDADLAQLMSTNFPSKIATYAMFQKPLIVWAPSYSTAAKFVREYDCALLIEDPDPEAVWLATAALSQDLKQQQQLADKALQLHREMLHPDKIHQTFVQYIEAACTQKRLIKKTRENDSKPMLLTHTHL